jgi:hypothetical protein
MAFKTNAELTAERQAREARRVMTIEQRGRALLEPPKDGLEYADMCAAILFAEEVGDVEETARLNGLVAIMRERSRKADAAAHATLEKTQKAREAVKEFGGKALRGGTPKQRKWAEELRSAALKPLKQNVAERVIADTRFQKTMWWIDNRKALAAQDFTDRVSA